RQVKLIAAETRALEVHERREARQAMAVQLERPIADYLAQRGHQRADAVDGEQASGILDHDRVDVGTLDQRLRRAYEQRVVVHGAFAIRQRAERVRAVRLR